jgi:hypothetical protein
MILIAGPYRSGTNDAPALIKKNVRQMESYALPVFRAGHIPILGEWLALPLVELGGSKKIGDEEFNRFSIRSRSGSSKSAPLYFESEARQPERMRWCA